MLTIDGGADLPLSRFWMAINPPNVVVSAQDASSIVAFGAAALAHCTSSEASSLSPFSPGSMQLWDLAVSGCTWVNFPLVKLVSPKVWRKVSQSDELASASSTTTTVWPLPVVPSAQRGFRL